MTHQEAQTVLSILFAAAVPTDVDEARAELLIRHLLPIPYEHARRRALAAATTLKWANSLGEVLGAVGIGESARPVLTRAVLEGGTIAADLTALSGWTHVPEGAALPAGVIRTAVALGEMPASAALPAGDDEPRPDSTRWRDEIRARMAAPPADRPALGSLSDDHPLVRAKLAELEAAIAKADAARDRANAAYAVYERLAGEVEQERRAEIENPSA